MKSSLPNIKRVGPDFTAEQLLTLVHSRFISEVDILKLIEVTGQIEIYKRTQLSMRYYACGGDDFDYLQWLRKCGTDLNHPTNSMSALLWKK